MPGLLSLSWRLLLALALAVNPVAGAAMSVAPPTRAAAPAEVPPCHDVEQAIPDADPNEEAGEHGCDCGNPACQFGRCCAVGALEMPSPFAMAVAATNHLSPAIPSKCVPSPTSARLIRPPIA